MQGSNSQLTAGKTLRDFSGEKREEVHMQLTEGAAVQGRSGMTYTLGRQFGSSGTGDAVFEIPGQNLAAKIYRDASAYLEQKITYMADHPVGNLEDTTGCPLVSSSQTLA